MPANHLASFYGRRLSRAGAAQMSNINDAPKPASKHDIMYGALAITG